jgi:hypothetical protein
MKKKKKKWFYKRVKGGEKVCISAMAQMGLYICKDNFFLQRYLVGKRLRGVRPDEPDGPLKDPQVKVAADGNLR